MKPNENIEMLERTIAAIVLNLKCKTAIRYLNILTDEARDRILQKAFGLLAAESANRQSSSTLRQTLARERNIDSNVTQGDER